MFRRNVPAMLVVSFALAAAARAEEPLFPFVVSYDAPDNVTNVFTWLGQETGHNGDQETGHNGSQTGSNAGPAGGHGFVRAESGHLATDAGEIRFWATNLCFDACFPAHEEAEHVAARMARLGINCVRMHHMDSRSIWGKSPNKLTIDPERLARLDYLIYQLKLHGIYVDINLHVSRSLGPKEGFPAVDQRPKYDKGLGNFEPRMIELQKKYARDLLMHVNPFTKMAYTREPAVAFVEISNEDALFTEWNRGSLDALPEPYATTYRQLWNGWLKKKYGDTERLRRAWNVGSQPLGDEMLDPHLSKPLGKAWRLQRDAQCKADWSVEEAGSDGRKCLRVVVAREGRESWIPQLLEGPVTIKAGKPYTLSFQARADRPMTVSVSCGMDHAPWQRLGLSAKVALDRQWKEHRFTFLGQQDDERGRISFSGLRPGTYELADMSLRPGGIVGLEPGQRLEDAGVPVLKHGEMNFTPTARRDFVDFLWDTERDYWWGMYHFVKEDLGVQAMVSGTQLNYGPVTIQAALDYIDAHAYWNHPSFPNRPWDRRDWYVRNLALVNSPGGTLSSLADRRVAGMAFTVSEYNHPAPNSYAAEGFPMIAAFGRFQGWDGIFSFTYSHSEDFEPNEIVSYFDIKSDPTKLVHMPACAALFRRGDAAPARRTVLAPMTPEAERAKLYETLNPRSLTADQFGLDPQTPLEHGVAMEIKGVRSDRIHAVSPGAESKRPDETGPYKRPTGPDEPGLGEQKTEFVSDTGQLRWDVSEPGAGYFIADTPNTKLFTGFVRGRTFRLGELTLAVGKTRLDWATVSILSVDGTGFAGPGRVLVAATGWVQNSGAELEDLGGDRVTLRDHWGHGPVLCEAVPAEITLPVAAERVHFYPLDASGNRRAAADVKERAGKALVTLDPGQHTLWYEIEIQ